MDTLHLLTDRKSLTVPLVVAISFIGDFKLDLDRTYTEDDFNNNEPSIGFYMVDKLAIKNGIFTINDIPVMKYTSTRPIVHVHWDKFSYDLRDCYRLYPGEWRDIRLYVKGISTIRRMLQYKEVRQLLRLGIKATIDGNTNICENYINDCFTHHRNKALLHFDQNEYITELLVALRMLNKHKPKITTVETTVTTNGDTSTRSAYITPTHYDVVLEIELIDDRDRIQIFRYSKGDNYGLRLYNIAEIFNIESTL